MGSYSGNGSIHSEWLLHTQDRVGLLKGLGAYLTKTFRPLGLRTLVDKYFIFKYILKFIIIILRTISIKIVYLITDRKNTVIFAI